jgi:mycothiol synthase
MKNTYYSYSYADTDLPAMFDLVRARPTNNVLDYPSLADLRELLAVTHTQQSTRVWMDPAGRLIGFAILNRGETYASLSLDIAAGENKELLAAQMIAWAEEFFRTSYHGHAETININIDENDPMRIALLERSGFTRQGETVLRMERDLTQPIAPVRIPAGFAIRSLLPDEEATWVSLHRSAFGTTNMTLESRQAMTQAPGYDPQLDLVATAADGRLAAYVYGSISAEENEQSGLKIGYTDPVGTHPDYQRRGLARALLLECLIRLRERGMQAARLGTGSWNSAMQRAAQSTGFQVIQRYVLFEKSVQNEPLERNPTAAGPAPAGGG